MAALVASSYFGEKAAQMVAARGSTMEGEMKELQDHCCVDDFLSDEISRRRSVCDFLSNVESSQPGTISASQSITNIGDIERPAKKRAAEMPSSVTMAPAILFKTELATHNSQTTFSHRIVPASICGPASPLDQKTVFKEFKPTASAPPPHPVDPRPRPPPLAILPAAVAAAAPARCDAEETEEEREQRRREQNREAQRRFRERRKYREFQAFSYRLAASAGAGAAGAAPLLARLAASFQC
jgi:hypothetical protein